MQNRNIKVVYLDTKLMPVDGLIKVLIVDKYIEFRKILGMELTRELENNKIEVEYVDLNKWED